MSTLALFIPSPRLASVLVVGDGEWWYGLDRNGEVRWVTDLLVYVPVEPSCYFLVFIVAGGGTDWIGAGKQNG